MLPANEKDIPVILGGFKHSDRAPLKGLLFVGASWPQVMLLDIGYGGVVAVGGTPRSATDRPPSDLGRFSRRQWRLPLLDASSLAI